MTISIVPTNAKDTLPWRTRCRSEANTQIVHDSIHSRSGWVNSYLLEVDHRTVGFGTVAIAGPWSGKPTAIEFYLTPDFRVRAFEIFEAFITASSAAFVEVQSSLNLLATLAHAYSSNLQTESIVFRDELTTCLKANEVELEPVTSKEESLSRFQERSGQSIWHLKIDGKQVGEGSLLFHYNYPYCDVAMSIEEEYRRRGLGSYLVQELKRIAYEMGGIPAARCNPKNAASKRTLQKAGFVPYAHILVGKLDSPVVDEVTRVTSP